MQNKPYIEKLIVKHLLGIISETEKDLLDKWIISSIKHEEQFKNLCSDINFSKRYKLYTQIDSKKAKRKFKQNHFKPFFYLSFKKFAAILLPPLFMVAIGTILYFSNSQQPSTLAAEEELILPGIAEATLALAKDSVSTILSEQVTKRLTHAYSPITIKEKLVYPQIALTESNTTNDILTDIDNHVLTTQKGNEFKVFFEDGTSVHLNYNTEIRYPIQFSKNKRIVYLKGEAYFKIAKDSRPFYVITAQGAIKQYGTEFNVNTYNPNHTEVTLVNGKVSILPANSKEELYMKPGQLAYIKHDQDKVQIRDIDITPYTAWNKGRFIFENNSLEEIVTILSHWYNVDVHFGNPSLKKLQFTGNLDRYSPISSILHAIARTTNLKIKIKGRNISITNN